jgi:hypothetical protein
LLAQQVVVILAKARIQLLVYPAYLKKLDPRLRGDDDLLLNLFQPSQPLMQNPQSLLSRFGEFLNYQVVGVINLPMDFALG